MVLNQILFILFLNVWPNLFITVEKFLNLSYLGIDVPLELEDGRRFFCANGNMDRKMADSHCR